MDIATAKFDSPDKFASMGNETAGFANAQQDETPQEGVHNSIQETTGEQPEAEKNQEATGEDAVKELFHQPYCNSYNSKEYKPITL